MKIIFKVPCVLLLISFEAVAQIHNTFKLNHDTLDVNDKRCYNVLDKNNYFNYKNLVISKSYQIIDSTKIDSGGHYKVLILSPLDQEDESFSFPCKLNIKRIIIVLSVLQNDLVRILDVNDNVILNKINYLTDPYIKDAQPTKNGFSLSFSVGSGRRCDLTLFFSILQGKVYLHKFSADYYTIDLRHSKTQKVTLKTSKNNELSHIGTSNLIKFPNW